MSNPSKVTPMIRQYLEIKEQNQDSILFYRMGDFYEMFFDDAIKASKILGITLTSRNSKDKKNKVPMCGIPFHASQTYLSKLIKAGLRVAICEQTGDPATTKGIVKREVVRIVSPGVVTDDQLLDEKNNNYICALSLGKPSGNTNFGISFLDLGTGEFLLGEFNNTATNYEQILDQLTRMSPAEIIIDSAYSKQLSPLISDTKSLLLSVCITERSHSFFNLNDCQESLSEHFGTTNLAGFGCAEMEYGIRAAGALFDYVKHTQKTDLNHIEKLSPIDLSSILQIDDSSRRNLELTHTIIGAHRNGSLISVLDKTRTPMGARLLKKRILAPLQDIDRINKRLNSVNHLFLTRNTREQLQGLLDSIYDIERLNTRIVIGTANARDLLALKHSLYHLPKIKEILLSCPTEKLLEIGLSLNTLEDLHNLLDQAVNADAPITLRDGNLIKKGFNEELDDLTNIITNGKQLLLKLEQQERQHTGIAKLKIGFNKVFGYYLEVSRAQSANIPEHYIRKQTLANAERFITPELKEFEEKIIGANDKRLELEYQLFITLRTNIAQASNHILRTAYNLAQIDFFTSLATVATLYNYTKPVINELDAITITEGRHPVIEQALPSGKFVPNDISLDQKNEEIMIITGPNMAGKSTILRQTAIIVLMAQMGSFIPAQAGTIGVVDRIFTRVGAMDDLRRGQSTFMVEMNETANILNNVTEKSLVILDEIGRGTSTYDGLAIAWAVTENLAQKNNKGVKTIFATHYHELTDLTKTEPRVHNYSVAVSEWKGKIVFLHKLIKGGTSRSYGIQVAALAGVPKDVIKRAKEILANIENSELNDKGVPNIVKDSTSHSPQLPLFSSQDNGIEQLISDTNPDELSPKQALDLIYKIKKLNN